ncbi:trans-sulfuration enzyme family protein [Clostridium acetobutylicum]|uniref:Cystathionine gamma-synthase n=1 Tax=Clostridium acetobutylicum (strain ATCC 824 / DSM 792 / JCM 1419 / IAM 19013 / LMG 5710 / NBRC 13948 / NRRL B-527 / VKM B-1787 / 2291 / W) TaxID=272562 RepID=Q97M10_CLOAB|nr:PLP-dependent aspartate aminotransferase family protein [Clostridium acetobutylicum]AAK78370.1 Cystathionine gamma-synthase [Clostridium acetobutylicum ATCC 824]
MGEIDCRNFETKAVHGESGFESRTGAISYPIYQSSTFRHEGLNKGTGYDYSRTGNPTRDEVEKTVAALENGRACLAYSSGMAAISSVLTIFKGGDHIIVSDDLYGGTYRIFEEIYEHYGIEVTYTDTTSTENIEKELRENTKAIYLETPTNPLMKITDIREVSKLAKEHNTLLIVDNTFMTPYYQKPLELGADIVLHSGTKYLCGHNDALAGFVILNDERLIEKLRFIQNSVGAVLAPFDSWLILRGIKTLHIRLDRQQENAIKIANFLKKHKKITKVLYPGLEEHVGHDILKSEASGFGAMISFYVDSKETVEKVLESVKVIIFAESLGGVESLITYPYTQTHADIPDDIRKRLGVTDKLLRFSVGIENVDDLIKDLDKALQA